MKLEEVYKEIENRSVKGNPRFYNPLDEKSSKLICEDYEKRLLLSLEGGYFIFYTKSGTLIAEEYERVVIGDYGAYVEFTPKQINKKVLKDKFYRCKAKPWQKYWWMETNDEPKIKVYEQIKPVRYADYKPGMFYISPIELYDILGERLYNLEGLNEL